MDVTLTAFAENAAGLSATAVTTTCSMVGGPDISARLLAIQSFLTKMAATPAGLANLQAQYNVSVNAQLRNWDIWRLHGVPTWASTRLNSGLLPSGRVSDTVNGNAYYQEDVNYWLYGVWTRVIGVSEWRGRFKIFGYRAFKQPDPAWTGREAWFDAGYTGVFGNALSAQIAGAVPDTSPAAIFPGKLLWHVGAVWAWS